MRDGLIVDLSALAEQVVNRATDHLLVAGYGCGREDHRIAVLNAHKAMILVCDTGQCRGWLPLATRAYNHDLLRVKLVDIFDANERPFRNVQVAQLHRHLYVIEHAAPSECNKPVVAYSSIDNLLHP